MQDVCPVEPSKYYLAHQKSPSSSESIQQVCKKIEGSSQESTDKEFIITAAKGDNTKQLTW